MTRHIQTMADHWSKLLVFCLVMEMSITQILGREVKITWLDSAVAKGAVCLDGSPPAYYYDPGFGEGANNWLVHLEGGGWCTTADGCGYRQTQHTGSSYRKDNITHFGQILSEVQAINPDFYNWNRVFVGYCDSGSYMGDIEEAHPTTNITRRGAKIFDAIMEELLSKGMANASMAVLSGESAGGLGAMLHCDGFRALVPNAHRVKCIIDSGFFLHAKNIPRAYEREYFYASLVEYHGITLPEKCTKRMKASNMDEHRCIFPENFIQDIQTPLFLVQPAFDFYQLTSNNFSRNPHFLHCATYLKECQPSEMLTMHDYRQATIQELQKISRSSPTTGIFVHSCYAHGHFYAGEGWNKSPILGDKTIAKAIGDWYFDRSSFQDIDTKVTTPQNCTLTHTLQPMIDSIRLKL